MTTNKDIFNVAIYGSVDGKQRRIQVYGTEQQLAEILSNYSSSVVLGNWCKDTLQLDLDKTSLSKAKYLGHRINNFFFHSRSGFIIFESSKRQFVAKELGEKGKVTYRCTERNYLMAFDTPISWCKNVHIMNWAGLESGNENLKKWVTMQCIKETSTLRFGAKVDKPAPKIVFRFGSQDRQIKKLLETRKIILDSLKQLKKEEFTREKCFGHMDNFDTGNCNVCSKEIRGDCYEKSFGDYFPKNGNAKEFVVVSEVT